MAPEDALLRERRDYRRRSLLALGASLALHALLLGLIFFAPTPSSIPLVALEISLPDAVGTNGDMGRSMLTRAISAPGAIAESAPSAAYSEREAEAEAAPARSGAGLAQVETPDNVDKTAVAGVESAGIGGGAAANGGAAGTGGAAEGDDQVAALSARLLAAVEVNKIYPAAARRRGTQGTVRLRFGVSEDGRLVSCELDASSGSALLDRAAAELLASVFPVVNETGKRLEKLRISVSYGLSR